MQSLPVVVPSRRLRHKSTFRPCGLQATSCDERPCAASASSVGRPPGTSSPSLPLRANVADMGATVWNRLGVCPICWEICRRPIVYEPCGHVTCMSCGLQWLRQQKICAECREKVTGAVQCLVLEELLEQHQARLEGTALASPTSAKRIRMTTTVAGHKELRSCLDEAGFSDMNRIPATYRGHVAREVARRAISRGDRSTVETCLSHLGVRASTRLLIRAALRWPEQPQVILSLLLDHGARIDGHASSRPLHDAVRSGNAEAAKALLMLRADPNQANGHGQTALHISARLGRFGATELLLASRALVHIQDRDHRTPLELSRLARNTHQRKCFDMRCARSAERSRVFRAISRAAREAPAGAQRRRVARGRAATGPSASGGAHGRQGVEPTVSAQGSASEDSSGSGETDLGSEVSDDIGSPASAGASESGTDVL